MRFCVEHEEKMVKGPDGQLVCFMCVHRHLNDPHFGCYMEDLTLGDTDDTAWEDDGGFDD